MVIPDPRDLHPRKGARFVLTRQDERRYQARVYRPRDEVLVDLSWDAAGQIRMDPEPDDPWLCEELCKLVRVLRRNPKPRMVRWRG